MPQHSTSLSGDGYRAARDRAAFFERLDRARIIVSGVDRASYLHGLLTNDITALTPGHGCYAAYLTPQGRMITDLFVYELGDVMLVVVPRPTRDTVLARFDQFIFSEDVRLGDVTDTFVETAVVGPQAGTLVARVLEGVQADALDAMGEHGNARATFSGQPAIVVRVADTGEPGFSLLVEQAQNAALHAALSAAGATASDRSTAETLRIESGVPRFGADLDEDTIPLEAGIESRAISFTKGCYVGQEVIIRVMHRGHGRVARKLVGLELPADAAVPSAGTEVRSGDRAIGRVTSAAYSPARGRPIALGYVHRDFVPPGTEVQVDGTPASVVALPFVPTRG